MPICRRPLLKVNAITKFGMAEMPIPAERPASFPNFILNADEKPLCSKKQRGLAFRDIFPGFRRLSGNRFGTRR